MIRILFLLINYFFLYSCIDISKESNKEIQNYKKQYITDLYILSDFISSKFDIEVFNKKRENKDSYGFYEGDSLYIEYSLSEIGYRIKKEILETPLIEYYYYDSLGVISKKYNVLYNSILYGDYLEYNNVGELINTIQKSSYFDYTYFNLMDFIDSMNINRDKLSFYLQYDSISNTYYWHLEETIRFGGFTRVFHLDVETGKLLNYMEYDYRDIDEKYFLWKLLNE